MDTLNHELRDLVAEAVPSLLDLEQLIAEDDLMLFDGECSAHDGCRSIGAGRV